VERPKFSFCHDDPHLPRFCCLGAALLYPENIDIARP
jgi:hypothetical protein